MFLATNSILKIKQSRFKDSKGDYYCYIKLIL